MVFATLSFNLEPPGLGFIDSTGKAKARSVQRQETSRGVNSFIANLHCIIK
jgi:hypothetical protein